MCQLTAINVNLRFFSPKGVVFSTMIAVFCKQNRTGLWTVQELALRHKAERTVRWLEGHSHHEWCFSGFCPLTLCALKISAISALSAGPKKTITLRAHC